MGDVPAISKIFNIVSPQCGSSVHKPPQTNSTKDFPNHGMADNKFVITVAKSLNYTL
jgi:hypothetical protein